VSVRSCQDIAKEAFSDFRKKHKQLLGLKTALKESVAEKPRKKSKR